MPTHRISAANSKSEFVVVPLGLASDMTFDDMSAGKSQCHTSGIDLAKVVKMQPLLLLPPYYSILPPKVVPSPVLAHVLVWRWSPSKWQQVPT
eukprot:5515417-Ditylum_brightwellii.AAC.1